MRLLPSALWTVLAAACAAQERPPTDAALREQAAAAERQGRFGEAADLFLELARRDAGRAEWVVAAGRCLGRSGRFNDAIEFLDERRHRFPGVLDVTAMLARTHLLKAEQDPGALHPQLSLHDAAALAQEILAVHPDHEDARLILAQAQYLLGDEAAASATAAEAVRRHPQRAGAHILAGRIAFDRFRLLKRRLAQPDLPDDLRARLVAAAEVERSTARAAFERAAALDPERTFALLALGELAAWDQDHTAAFEHWLRALAVDPAVRIDHDEIAARLDWQTRRDGYRRALQLHQQRPGSTPQSTALLQWQLARALFDGGEYAAAERAFGDVLAARADYTNAHYWLFLCAVRQQDHDAAERHAAAYSAVSAAAFADVLRELGPELRGELATMLQYLADRAFQQGRLESSRDLNHTMACLRDSADAWNNYAFLARETGRFEDALAGYQHALEREPDSPQLWNDCGVILHYHLPTAENRAKAARMYERAIELAVPVLADPRADPKLRERARRARDDAKANLQALGGR